jgi:hypothetical protein
LPVAGEPFYSPAGHLVRGTNFMEVVSLLSRRIRKKSRPFSFSKNAVILGVFVPRFAARCEMSPAFGAGYASRIVERRRRGTRRWAFGDEGVPPLTGAQI